MKRLYKSLRQRIRRPIGRPGDDHSKLDCIELLRGFSRTTPTIVPTALNAARQRWRQ
jgi:hypothetical protein